MSRYELSTPFAPRFVSFTRALPPLRLYFAPARIDATRAGPDYLFPAPSSARFSVETLRTPRFLGKPQCVRAPLFDPAGPLASGQFHASDTAFRSIDDVGSGSSLFRGSITQLSRPLCTLRSRDHSLTTQHSVPAGDQPLPGRILTCQVCYKRFTALLIFRTYKASSSSKLGLAQLPWKT